MSFFLRKFGPFVWLIFKIHKGFFEFLLLNNMQMFFKVLSPTSKTSKLLLLYLTSLPLHLIVTKPHFLPFFHGFVHRINDWQNHLYHLSLFHEKIMNDVKKEGFLFLFVAVVLANNCLIFDNLTDLKFLF